MPELVLQTDAELFYEDADPVLKKKLARCFDSLSVDPLRGNNVKRLKGEYAGYWRYRIGDWRVIFHIDPKRDKVFVATIAHRSEVYE